MSLILHLGSSGTGKTYSLTRKIVDEAKQHFERNYLFIVPEQFTLETQKSMISVSESGGIMNVDVLSFPRLAHRVFEETGYETPLTLEDTGKTMIVKKVALDKADELTLYAGKVHRQGFIQEMKSVIAEFYQYGIDEEELARMCEMAKGRPNLGNKLKDISVIYRGFKDFINGRFIMNEELLELMMEKAEEAEFLRGAVVAFDGFTGFTVMQLRVIECLMRLGCDIHVTLTIDAKDAAKKADPEDLFYLSEKTIEKLVRIADQCDALVETKLYEPKVPYRFVSAPGIAALEHNLFRRNRARAQKPEDIKIVSCENPGAEVRYAISEIRRLVATCGYKYGELAIIAGDVNSYSKLLDREFQKSGIPYFIDSKKNIVGTAPVEFIKAVLEIASSDYTYESVFRFLKTGLTGIDADEIAKLENYCLARAVRGRRMWTRTFDGRYMTRYKPDPEAINATRERVCAILTNATERLNDKDITVRERIDVLRGVLKQCDVYARLESMSLEGRMSADARVRLEASENGQLPEIIEKVFERIEMLLGDDVLNLREFSEILNTGFNEAKLALLPQGSDCVVVGDMERTRLTGIKALFLLGVNDGIVPAVKGDAGILSDSDRSIFEENDIELSPTKRASAYLNEFYMYLNLTKPTHRLYLTYYRMSSDKKPGRPSYLIGKIKRSFDGLETEEIFAGDEAILTGSDCGIKSMAAAVREKAVTELTPAEREILARLLKSDRNLYEKLISAAFYERMPEHITPENAEKLYGRMLTGSVTMLEKYASCAFSHFLTYGLKLEERAEYEISAVELGKIYHKALECYCKDLRNEDIRWHDTDEQIRASHKEQAISEALLEYSNVFIDSSRNEYIKTRVDRILTRTIEILDAQVKAGEFEPRYFEKSFSHATEFMALAGVIDRMDVANLNGRKVLRVIDYKSGHKSFDLAKLFYGLQIQLAVYMSEGMKEVDKGHGSTDFAGMYYYNINDPIVETDGSEEGVREATMKALRMLGPSLNDGKVLRLHDLGLADEDGTLTAGYTSKIVTAGTTAKGELGRNAKVMTAEQFETISEYVEMMLKDNCERILKGDTAVNPYAMDNINSCSYCRFKGVCGFDRSLGDKYRTIRKESEDDIWLHINGALSREQ